jgi:acyl dehydratase
MSTPATVDGIAGVQELIGQPLGPTDWYTVSQEQVNLFADATGDHQWIHLDPERAKDGPFGTPIAHGFLTLSLIVQFMSELLEVSGISMAVNYGLNKVRFPAPVPVGSRIRASAVIDTADEFVGGVQTTMTITIEIEGGAKPACVAESVSRFYA